MTNLELVQRLKDVLLVNGSDVIEVNDQENSDNFTVSINSHKTIDVNGTRIYFNSKYAPNILSINELTKALNDYLNTPKVKRVRKYILIANLDSAHLENSLAVGVREDGSFLLFPVKELYTRRANEISLFAQGTEFDTKIKQMRFELYSLQYFAGVFE